MENKNTKKLTARIIAFIEKLAEKYNIEKFDIENNQPLKDKIAKAESFPEKMSLMFLYDKKVDEYIKAHKPLEDLFPSLKINKIVEDLINKKIVFDDLKTLLQKNIVIDPSVIDYLAKEIANNQDINDLMNNKTTEENTEKEKIDEQIINNQISIKSIGYELMK